MWIYTGHINYGIKSASTRKVICGFGLLNAWVYRITLLISQRPEPKITKLILPSLKSQASALLKWQPVAISTNQMLEIWDSSRHFSQSDTWDLRLILPFQPIRCFRSKTGLAISANQMLEIWDLSRHFSQSDTWDLRLVLPFQPIRWLDIWDWSLVLWSWALW
jgi:hypothetical protein